MIHLLKKNIINPHNLLILELLKKKDKKYQIFHFEMQTGTGNFSEVDLELLFSQNPLTQNNDEILNKVIDLIYLNEILKISSPKESSSPTDKNIHHYIDLPNNYKQKNI